MSDVVYIDEFFTGLKNNDENEKKIKVSENNAKQSMEIVYKADQNISGGKWYFNPDAYMENITLCSSMITGISEYISLALDAQNRVTGNMKSPEGQDIEGSVTECFSKTIANVQSISAGLSYIIQWANERYSKGVKANLISGDVVNEIQDTLAKAGFVMGDTSGTWKQNDRTYKYDPTTRKSTNCRGR